MSDDTKKIELAEAGLKISADFLLAEFNALQSRAIAFKNSQSNRVNFLLIIVAAALAGVSQLANNLALQSYFHTIILATASGILLLGLFTLRQNVDDAGASIILFRRAGRIRLWFVEQNPQIAQYVAFEYGDDKPAMDVPFLSFRGGEAVILLINALSFCVMVGSILPLQKLAIVLVVLFISFIIAWVSQSYYIHKVLQIGEKRSADTIKFSFEQQREKYEGHL
ncbi:MAG: hypothetical protein D6694_10105 [Gammaproteobacteria bacterium]|nr:MAG: hypothetical protein D6694_10105 [Gammaproteobacteria bacterium]